MFTYFNRFGLLGCVVVLTGLYGCVTTQPAIEAQKALLSRASYEQIRPAIETIQVGDEMSNVFEIVRLKKGNGSIIRESNRLSGQFKYFVFPMWPGVLTPFWDLRVYINAQWNADADPKVISLPTGYMHFGYLDGAMLRPRKILIFENKKVSKIIDIPDIEKSMTEPGVTVTKVDPLDHYRRQEYENYFLPKKDQITPGMDLWEVFTLLNASYIMAPDAQSYAVICPGYLNYKRPVMAEKTPEGVRAIYPFGYVEGDTEILKWKVEMLNDRVVSVRARKE